LKFFQTEKGLGFTKSCHRRRCSESPLSGCLKAEPKSFRPEKSIDLTNLPKSGAKTP
jgi:hypothetical protein